MSEETAQSAVKAVVKTAFDGVPDGQVWPKSFAPGDEVEGNLAEVAIAEGWAKPAKLAKGAASAD